ncbi:MAG: PAS domain S-box protein [Spirochaetes bacterium]|nr:PAS domain S-box protein [Spirochaetota bacterium]
MQRITRIFDLLFRLLIHRTDIDTEERSRRIIFIMLNSLAIPMIGVFGIEKIRNGEYLFGMTDLALSGLLVGAILLLRRLRRGAPLFRLGVFFLILGSTYWLYTGVNEGSSSLWYLAIPTVVFFMFGKREGLLWTFSLFLVSIAAFAGNRLSHGAFHYSTTFVTRHLLLQLLVTLLTFSYESVRTIYKKSMEDRQEKLLLERNALDRTNALLRGEIEERERIEEELQTHRERLEELVSLRTDELRRKHIELAESERRYRLIADNIAETIWVLDFDARFTYVSPSIKNLCGYTCEEILDQTPEQIIAAGSRQVFDDIIALMREWRRSERTNHDDFYSLELELLHRDGSTIWTTNTISYMRDEEGAIIGLLGITKDITDKMLIEQQLRTSLREKEVLLKELYHRTKNNMQVISSMISLMAKKPGNEGFHDFGMDLEMKIRSMALVHQKLYESNDLTYINLREYVAALSSYLMNIFQVAPGILSFQFNVESIGLSIDTAIPFGLVLNELISNSIKHAFRGISDNRISLDIAETEGGLTVKYRDNGVGLPRGFDQSLSPSMGMVIMRNLVERQLRGTMVLRDEKGFSCDIFINTGLYHSRV